VVAKAEKVTNKGDAPAASISEGNGQPTLGLDGQLLRVEAIQKCFGQTNEFRRLLIQGEVSCIENMNLGSRDVFPVGLRTRDSK